MKRVFVIVGLLLLAFLFVVIVWQPEALQKKVVSIIASQVAQSTPYRLQVHDVSGNFFTRFSLNGVQIRAEGVPGELLRAKALKIGVAWLALLHKRIEVNQIILTDPVVRLTLDSQGHLLLPPAKPTPKNASPAKPLDVNLIEIRGGKLVLINQSVKPAAELIIEPIDLKAKMTPKTISLEELALGLEGGRARLSGDVGLAKPLTAQLRLRFKNFPMHALARAASPVPAALHLVHTGEWRVKGRGDEWSLHESGLLNNANLDLDARVELDGPYDAKLSLARLSVDETWKAQGLKTACLVSAHLSLSAANPKSQKINAHGTVEVARPTKTGDGAALLTAKSDLTEGTGIVQLSAALAGLSASATAQMNAPNRTVDSRFQVALSSFSGLSEFIPTLRSAEGQISANGSAKGQWTALHVDASAHGQHLDIQDKSIEDIGLIMKGDTGPGQNLSIDASLKNAALSADTETPWDILSGQLQATGNQPRWTASANLKFRNGSKFKYAGQIRKTASDLKVDWDTLSLAPATGSTIANTKRGYFHTHPDGTQEVHDLVLSDGKGLMTLNRAYFRAGTADVDFVAKDVPLQSLVRFAAPTLSYEGTLGAHLHTSGPLNRPTGEILVDISSGTFQKWGFKDVILDAEFAPPWILVRRLEVDVSSQEQNIYGKGRLPMHFINEKLPNLPMDLSFKAPHIDPKLLTATVPGLVIDKGGTAALNLRIQGLYPDVNTEGNLVAQFPHIVMTSAGLDLHDFHADVRSYGKTIDIKEFVAKTKKGDLLIAGQSTIPNLNFTLQGQKVALNIPQKLDATADVDLAIGGDLQGPDVSGEIAISEATYTVPKKTKKEKKLEQAQQEEKDQQEQIAVSPAPQTHSVWEGTTMDVHASWPGRVFYRDGLTKIETSGDLRLQKDDGTDTPYMTGRIALVRGTYDAYGRDFVMDSGDIVFTGPPDINPLLNIEAKYSSGGTVVYLDVRGTAKVPQLNLRSNPPLPEQDIISVLVLGQPLNQIGPSQGTPTSRSSQATALAGSVIGGYVTKELRESGMDVLGLDVVRVEPTSTGGNRLTVGRYVGQKLFVSYGQPLQASAQRVFDAYYYISKRWTLAGETGERSDSHLDFQFRYPLNTPEYPKDKSVSLMKKSARKHAAK